MMSLRERSSKHSDTSGVVKRTSIVLVILLTIIALVWMVSYLQRPQIKYSLKRADCSSSAIAARNQPIGATLQSCILIVSATNLKNNNPYVDYDSAGGGPVGKGNPLIRIYSVNDTFCYAAPGGESASFTPHGTNDLTLLCAGVLEEPKNYDMTSDANPKYIQISANYAKVRINVDPVR